MQSATMPQNEVQPDAKPVELSIVASGSARLTMPELAAIRKQAPPGLPIVLSPQLLRHSDEQTLAALVALSEATKNVVTASKDFDDWAIVSSSRNLGRSAFAGVIDKYRTEGPWGVSVQVIPHCAAHAVAGTISLALASHGPCIGAGSGPAGEIEAIFSVASILRQAKWRGAWLVFSGWSPELVIDAAGRPTSDSVCVAATIAVTRQPCPDSLGRIRIEMPSINPSKRQSPSTRNGGSSSGSLTEFLAGATADCRSWSSPAPGAMRIRVGFDRGGWREHLALPSTVESYRLRQSSRINLVSSIGLPERSAKGKS